MAMQDYVWWLPLGFATWKDENGRAKAFTTVVPVRSDGTIGESQRFYAPTLEAGYEYQQRNSFSMFPTAFTPASLDRRLSYNHGEPVCVIGGDFVTFNNPSASNANDLDGETVQLKMWRSRPVPEADALEVEDDGVTQVLSASVTLPTPREGSGQMDVSSEAGWGAGGLRISGHAMLTWYATNLGWLYTASQYLLSEAGLSSSERVQETDGFRSSLGGFNVDFDDGTSGSFDAWCLQIQEV